MAIDDALLESAGTGLLTLRLYAWSEPVLSLGYFQRAADRLSDRRLAECTWVRRPSGGGAILHDREITYSLAVPNRLLPARAHLELYEQVHQAAIDLLRELGGEARLCGNGAAGFPAAPFLCFHRRSPADVLLCGQKVLGSAQRRRHAGLLQHGSFLLAASPLLPELPGVAEVLGCQIDSSEVRFFLAERICRQLGWQMSAAPLSIGETALSRHFAETRYLSPRWSHLR
jgi:lipoate-protein ligase A